MPRGASAGGITLQGPSARLVGRLPAPVHGRSSACFRPTILEHSFAAVHAPLIIEGWSRCVDEAGARLVLVLVVVGAGMTAVADAEQRVLGVGGLVRVSAAGRARYRRVWTGHRRR